MRRRILFALALAVSSLLILSACSTATPPQSTPAPSNDGATQSPSTGDAASGTTLDGATLLAERCSICHAVDKATAEDRDATGWGVIVDRMIANGAQLTPEEKDVLIGYLAENYGSK